MREEMTLGPPVKFKKAGKWSTNRQFMNENAIAYES